MKATKLQSGMEWDTVWRFAIHRIDIYWEVMSSSFINVIFKDVGHGKDSTA